MGTIERIKNISSSYRIEYSEDYVCVISNSLKIYKRKDFSFVCMFNDMRHYSQVKFLDKDIFAAGTTECRFAVYNITNKECIWYKKPKGDFVSDSTIIVSCDGKKLYRTAIYDKTGAECKTVLVEADIEKNKFYIQNLWQRSASNCLIKVDDAHLRVLTSYSYIDNLDKFYTGIREIDIIKKDVIDYLILYRGYNKTADQVGSYEYYSGKYIFYKFFERTSNKIMLIDLEKSQKEIYILPDPLENYGYSTQFKVYKEKIIILVFSKYVILLEKQIGKIIKQYQVAYCSDADFMDGDLYISTWEGLFVVRGLERELFSLQDPDAVTF